jgi:hypothetical protein
LNKAQRRLISLNQGKLIEAGGFSICLLAEGQESRGPRHKVNISRTHWACVGQLHFHATQFTCNRNETSGQSQIFCPKFDKRITKNEAKIITILTKFPVFPLFTGTTVPVPESLSGSKKIKINLASSHLPSFGAYI